MENPSERGLPAGRPAACLLIMVLLAVFPAAARSAELPAIKKNCSTCHRDPVNGKELIAPVSSLCLGCHPGWKAPAEHRVDLVPSMSVNGLPLQAGKMTCVTCHDPHSNNQGKMLRVPARELCFRCHSV